MADEYTRCLSADSLWGSVQAGSDIYSMESRNARDMLERALDAQKAANALERERMLQRQADREAAEDRVFITACNNDPTLPYCPYAPPARYNFEPLDPEDYGASVYAATAEAARRQQDQMEADGKRAAMNRLWEAEVARYEREWEHARVVMDACERSNNQLIGCPYYPEIAPPQMPVDFESQGDLTWAFHQREQADKLEAARIANKQRQARLVAVPPSQQPKLALALPCPEGSHKFVLNVQYDEMIAEREAKERQAAERFAAACAMNPSLPGCPY